MTHAKVCLRPWQPVRVWRNQTDAQQLRTIAVYPCIEAFPPGCQIKLFEAPDEDGVAPTNGHVDVGQKGDSVALSVKPGHAVFVHIDLSNCKTATVLADITQEP